jgi:hypothetical protein
MPSELVDSEGLVLKARVRSAKVPDKDGIRPYCRTRRTSAFSAFRTCGSMRRLPGEGQEVGRTGIGCLSVEVLYKAQKSVPGGLLGSGP